MTEEQVKMMRERLLRERDEVLGDLERQRAADREATGDGTEDAADRAEVELERAFEHRRESDDSHLLQKIGHALARLDEGVYEVCDGCQGIIPWERLEARPFASLCHACQQAKEDGKVVEVPR